MGEQDSTAPARSLEVSISFGRFENDLLSWDKWSTFSQNKYLEEVEKCATPGSVAEKKAYFEARNKLIGMRKMEVCQESSEETQEHNTYDANQYDEEVMEENIFESGMSSPDIGEQIELETDVFEPREIDVDGTDEDASTNHYILEKETEKTIAESKTSYSVGTGDRDVEPNVFELEPEVPAKGNQEDKPCKNTSKFNIYHCQDAPGKVKEDPILSERRSCCTYENLSIETYVSGSVSTDGENQVGNVRGTGSQNNESMDLPEGLKEGIVTKIELGLGMSNQLKVDAAAASKNSTYEAENLKSDNTMDIHELETEKKAVEPECSAELPVDLENKSGQPKKVVCVENPRKSSKKILPAHKPRTVEKVNKTQVSSVPRSPQISTPRISKPSTPLVTSASRISPMSRVKKTATSVVAKKSSQLISPVGSTPKLKTPSMIPSIQSPSKKGSDSLSSSKRSISTGGSRKPTSTSLHMSLNFSPKVAGSTPVSGAASVTEPRRSLIMEKMGDKDIVKRAFRAFQNMSIPSSYASTDMTAPPNKVVRNRSDTSPSTQLLQKDKERLVRNGGVDEKSKKPAPSIFKSHDMEDKRKEMPWVKKAVEKGKFKGAAQTNIQSNYKERDTHTEDRRQSINYKGSPLTSSYQGQRLSKSFQDQGGAQV